ncbi:MAG: hypothetical protein KF841_10635 [Phycisphaerae bacterium]|nr:hypothetical protein [Phycisphaerae bacterium]
MRPSRTQRVVNTQFIVCFAGIAWAMSAMPQSVIGQVRWQIAGADATIDGNASSNELNITGPLTVVNETCQQTGAFLPSVAGTNGVVHEYGYKCFREAVEEVLPPGGGPPLRVQSVIKARAFIDGDNTDEITVQWLNLSYCDQFTDGHIAAATMALNFNIDLNIVNGPAGAPVLVYYYWDAFGGASTSHECPQNPLHPNCAGGLAGEDAVRTNNRLEVGGRELLGGRFDFASPGGLPGWNVKNNQGGAIAARVGDTIRIAMDSITRASLLDPGPNGIQVGPESDAIFQGRLRITVGYVAPQIPPVNPVEPQREFSLDIGSDSEMSDPQAAGNESFDPGDVYLWQQAIAPNCGANGFRDDTTAFAGSDPSPSAGDCASIAPVCFGTWVNSSWFDLDGTDSIDLSLAGIPGFFGPISVSGSSCIHFPEHLMVSFDDDSATHYGAPAGFCSVPTNSLSPIRAHTYGTSAGRDEVIYLRLDDAAINPAPLPRAATVFSVNIADEATVHSYLAPNPDLSGSDDDDVDALDINDPAAGCDHWYFSCDHEATWFDPINGISLDPGDIYEVVNGIPIVAIDHAVHLGLPDGVDIDAFEFVQLHSSALGGVFVALLFSVADDDPASNLDESGGLNPAMIYASFLDGLSFPYLDAPLADDIDAIAVWSAAIVPAPTSGACCLAQNGCILTLSGGDCAAFGGTFMGLGTDCADINGNGDADICECQGCRGDLNGDHSIDGRDAQGFVDCVIATASGPCGCADLDGDGQLGLADVQLFVITLLSGPLQSCP